MSLLAVEPARTIKPARKRRVKAHAWPAEADGWYIEPAWCSARLFDVEKFPGAWIDDPCCGVGTIPRTAEAAGYAVEASDLRDRGYKYATVGDFLTSTVRRSNIVCNPPFHDIERFAGHALENTAHKVAFVVPLARLPAAHWLRETPLARVWMLTPRPSMPPGHVIVAGEKPGGGTADFCWLVWEQGYAGPPELRWLHRDEGAR